MEITQDLADSAAAKETELMASNPSVVAAQSQHLQNRVIMLRALSDQLQEENDALRLQLSQLTAPVVEAAPPIEE